MKNCCCQTCAPKTSTSPMESRSTQRSPLAFLVMGITTLLLSSIGLAIGCATLCLPIIILSSLTMLAGAYCLYQAYKAHKAQTSPSKTSQKHQKKDHAN